MRHVLAGILGVVACIEAGVAERTVWMDTLDLGAIHQDYGEARANLSMRNRPLRLGGADLERGVGTHASGVIHVALDGRAKRFLALVGVDDRAGGKGSVVIRVYSVDRKLFDSGVLLRGGEPVSVDLDIGGLDRLTLIMGDAGDGISHDHVSWGNARFVVEGEDPRIVTAPDEPQVVRTPAPPKAPRINGPPVTGVRPGAPFIYRVPATGVRPMCFSAQNLPEGLQLDGGSGVVCGRISDRTHRAYDVTLVAENEHGRDERTLRIVVGDTLALTPPMGWNHWYAHYDRITDAMMREAADILVGSGMADVGYQYVNIDDCWANRAEHADPMRVGPFRDGDGNILPNAHFPDMNALTEYIHAMGLRAGIYTSPGPTTCAGFAGSWEHEEQDARQFAAWGFDFLKYDWCSYTEIAHGRSQDELEKPYIAMGGILRKLDRDIVLNLCQYGMGDVWTWGERVGGHCWRTAGDLGFELTRYHAVARRNAEHHAHARPGAWNDPDYLLVGHVGSAREMGEPVPCPLTPNEQYSYMSLWCLMAAPLFYSGDMTRLDAFTLNVLCNPDVIAINQDALGRQGYCVLERDEGEVWTKPLADGSLAVGLFNRAEIPARVGVVWREIGLTDRQRVRDLWRHEDLGLHEAGFEAELGRHDVALLRVWPAVE